MRAEGRFTARNAALASAAQQSGGASRTVVMGPDGESLPAHPSSAEHWTGCVKRSLAAADHHGAAARSRRVKTLAVVRASPSPWWASPATWWVAQRRNRQARRVRDIAAANLESTVGLYTAKVTEWRPHLDGEVMLMLEQFCS